MSRHPHIGASVRRLAASLGTCAVLGLAASGSVLGQEAEADSARTIAPQTGSDTTARLTGTVASGQTGGTISTARILLPELGRGAISDADGRFTIEDLPPGVYEARVEYFGFSTNQRPVRLEPGSITRVTFMLDENVLEVAELEVEVKRPPGSDYLEDFRYREERGFGFHFGPEDIEERNPRRTSDLLRSVPSIYVRTNNIQGRGIVYFGHGPQVRCRPNIWVDGAFAERYFVDNVAATDLLAVEVYRRPSETPPEFERTTSGQCGTIVIWTRRGPGQRGEGRGGG